MGDNYLGEIRMVGFNFAPVGWAICDGSILSIAQYSALFALLGTQFGGDGVRTFGLPDLRGRVPLNAGQGLNLPPYVVGQSGGQNSVTLTVNNLPAHAHAVQPPVSTGNGTAASPANGYPATASSTLDGGQRGETVTTKSYAASATQGQYEASYQTGPAGGSLPIPVQPPYLAVNFIIALTGIFPSRS